MFTGFVDLYQAISSNEGLVSTQEEGCLESMDKLKSLYSFDKKDIGCLPDSIQQVLAHSCCNKRLSLSVLVYELISELEQGYSTNEFHKKLQRIICHIDQSESRAANDLARQLVLLNRDFSFSSYNMLPFYFRQILRRLERFKFCINVPNHDFRPSETGCQLRYA